ncbi:type II toxin-antitoxin system Phd/YefM family antitoxin [Nitrosomonas eutropha]|uniref:Antitoxin n=2 Tax=Nitrosomonas eutropha TaxID=916 RepID=A0ABX5M5Z3_9PROT|nr:type II toxin-antitoxin system Phd/YefM family antitoxin [Nitrosomonas eutropha]ABI58904.1 prevent-host-death family protein [Nitrosomonas eutropha C91]PXV77251.1 antitoxin Phd_YefM of type II toxin-antitoxin system [Nitrosomonas eutropha]SEI83463.1 Antitoxin Phd_YefM, type II toxin-antitoxin system [Nitrosomonas eutropha]
MQSVNTLEAKSSLSRLVDAIEQGQEREIIIARNGRPAARLVAIKETLLARVSASPKASSKCRIVLIRAMKKLHSY